MLAIAPAFLDLMSGIGLPGLPVNRNIQTVQNWSKWVFLLIYKLLGIEN